jgi:hypothetical protein
MDLGATRRPFLPSGWVARGSVLFAIWLGTLVIAWWFLPGADPECIWISSSGHPTPSDFRYAMFPATNDVPIFDRPDGKEVGTLTRAMVNVESEVRAGGWVEVIDPAGSNWVRFEDLRYRAAPGSTTGYFDAFEKAYQARDPADFRTASLRFKEGRGGPTRLTLHLGQDDAWQEYVYQLSGEIATPLVAYIMHGPSAGIIETSRIMGAMVVAAVAVGGWVVIGEAWRRRARRKPLRTMLGATTSID